MRVSLKTVMTWFFGAVSLFAGVGFLIKLFEFWVSLEDRAMLGFAIAPLTNYFLVAGGFLALLIWAFLSGQFSDSESIKHEMLREQKAMDALDGHVQNATASPMEKGEEA